jgi:hypothetical protein
VEAGAEQFFLFLYSSELLAGCRMRRRSESRSRNLTWPKTTCVDVSGICRYISMFSLSLSISRARALRVCLFVCVCVCIYMYVSIKYRKMMAELEGMDLHFAQGRGSSAQVVTCARVFVHVRPCVCVCLYR